MKIFSQGLIDKLDPFIHADYLSSLSKVDYTQFEYSNTFFLIGIILFILGLIAFIFLHIKKKKVLKDNIKEEKKDQKPEYLW